MAADMTTTEKRALLARLLREKAERPKTAELSFAQKRLWFLDQFEPGNPIYNVPAALDLQGPLDVPSLERALYQIIIRHEALRTTFPAIDGEPIASIAPSVTIDIPVVDVSSNPNPSVACEETTRQVAEAPFKLANGPLIRATVVRISEQRHRLAVALHHSVTDGWSMGILFSELASLYNAFAAGEAPQLSPLPIQYADFAKWQRERISGNLLDEELAFWRRRLANPPEILSLAFDYPRPPFKTLRGARLASSLPEPLCDKLRVLAVQSNTSLFMTMMAVFNVLLYRYTDQSDIVVGTPIANRDKTELEGLIGFFVNTLPLRTDMSGEQTFRDVLSRVREGVLEAFSHSELPFEKLVEALQPERSLGHNPFFEVMFVLQSALQAISCHNGLTMIPREIERNLSRMDLTLAVMDEGKTLTPILEYNSDLFEPETIHRMQGHLRVLLEAIVATPEMKIGRLPVLTNSERRQILVEWNQTDAIYPLDASLQELFEKQVERSPNSIAVEFDADIVTYRELNVRANRLAHRLLKLGVGPDVPVAVSLERSLEMVVAFLAIIKAGGAYVPIDSSYPAERIALMLDDTAAPVIVTQESQVSKLPETKARLFVFERDDLDAESDVNPPCFVTDINLAYIIYTSGSTGRPKGIAIPHRGVARLVFNSNYLEFDASLRIAQASNASFDAATMEIWGALLHGGTLVGVPREVILSPVTFAAYLREERIDTIFLTTALFNQMARESPLAFSHMKNLLVGGEAVDPQWIREVLEKGSPQRLLNAYGPTESTTFAVCKLVEFVPPDSVAIPIGRPISNTTCFVVDRNMQPVPAGVTGELLIGGAGLARGYVNNAAATAESFIPNPFVSSDQGDRLYRTGDLVKRSSIGDIVFVGRIDFQVKIRGLRIELGEIESSLQTHPGVQECVVLVREDTPGDKRIAAYVVPHDAAKLSDGDLRAFLKSKLPEFMTPSSFVVLERLPINANGKIDRGALPPPGEARLNSEGVERKPRNPDEELLAAIWREVLGVAEVGIYDSFFDLGGHSLLATLVLSRIRDAFELEVPLQALFEDPTVAGLAAEIAELRQSGFAPIVPAIKRASRDRPIPTSFAQQRLWLINRMEPGSFLYNVPVAIRIRGSLDSAALERTLNEIIRRHESLRTTLIGTEHEAVQVIATVEPVALPIEDYTHIPIAGRDSALADIALDEYRRPFDITVGPVIRARLIQLDAEDHALLLTLHHIVSDGWSLGVIFREISVIYDAYINNQPSPLEELPIQYADYAVWERERMQGDALKGLLDYWRGHLDGAPTILELPADRPRPMNQTFRGARVKFAFDPVLTSGIRTLAQNQNATVFMTLLAAFESVIYRYTTREDFLVGTDVANRAQSDVEGLIGFFLNHVVLRANMAGDPSFTELLARVKLDALGAFSHQDLSFDKLVEALNPERSAGHTPLFQLLFVLQSASGAAPELQGLQVDFIPFRQETSKYDVAVFLRESDNQIDGSVLYQTDIFDESRIAKMAEHFQNVVCEAVKNPAKRLSELSMLSGHETGGTSAQSFAKAGLSQKDFEKMLQQMARPGKQ